MYIGYVLNSTTIVINVTHLEEENERGEKCLKCVTKRAEEEILEPSHSYHALSIVNHWQTGANEQPIGKRQRKEKIFGAHSQRRRGIAVVRCSCERLHDRIRKEKATPKSDALTHSTSHTFGGAKTRMGDGVRFSGFERWKEKKMICWFVLTRGKDTASEPIS